jgi:hypothetical protein
MVAGPDAMVMGAWLVGVIMPVPMIVRMAMVVIMTVRMPVRMQGVVVRHGRSLARYWYKVA